MFSYARHFEQWLLMLKSVFVQLQMPKYDKSETYNYLKFPILISLI